MNGKLKFGKIELDNWEPYRFQANEDRYLFRYPTDGKRGAVVGMAANSEAKWKGQLVWFLGPLEFLNGRVDQIGLKEEDPLEVRQNKVDEFLVRMDKLKAFE